MNESYTNAHAVSARHLILTAIVALFAVGLFLIHDLIWLYHDDFGYATLSYITTIDGITGQDFKQINLLAFLKNEYMTWTGRVLPFFIEANVFKIGLPFTRAVQALVCLAITLLAAKMADGPKLSPLALIFLIAYFCAIPLFIAAGGLFWFSASISYVWGFPFLFYGAYRLQNDGVLTLQSVAALSLAALFQEQVAVACVAIAGLVALEHLWREKTLKKAATLLFTTAPILLATCFILFSPGNFNRKANSTYPEDGDRSVADINMEKVADTLLSPTGNPNWENDSTIWLVILGASLVALLIMGLSLRHKLVDGLMAIFAVIISFTLILEWPEYNILLCLLLAYGIFLFETQRREKNGFIVFYIYVAAIASLLLMLFSPAIAGRQFIPFFILMSVPVAYSFIRFAHSDFKPIAAVMALALLPLAAEQSVDIYKKYSVNDVYMADNDLLLRQAGDRARQGLLVEPLTLAKLPDSRYAEMMAYQRDKVEKWVRRYYVIPDYVEIDWIAPPPPPKPREADK